MSKLECGGSDTPQSCCGVVHLRYSNETDTLEFRNEDEFAKAVLANEELVKLLKQLLKEGFGKISSIGLSDGVFIFNVGGYGYSVSIYNFSHADEKFYRLYHSTNESDILEGRWFYAVARVKSEWEN